MSNLDEFEHHLISEEGRTPQEAWSNFWREVAFRGINWNQEIYWRHLPELVHNIEFDSLNNDTYKVRARFSVKYK